MDVHNKLQSFRTQVYDESMHSFVEILLCAAQRDKDASRRLFVYVLMSVTSDPQPWCDMLRFI